jgi:hypothetical protein
VPRRRGACEVTMWRVWLCACMRGRGECAGEAGNSERSRTGMRARDDTWRLPRHRASAHAREPRDPTTSANNAAVRPTGGGIRAARAEHAVRATRGRGRPTRREPRPRAAPLNVARWRAAVWGFTVGIGSRYYSASTPTKNPQSVSRLRRAEVVVQFTAALQHTADNAGAVQVCERSRLSRRGGADDDSEPPTLRHALGEESGQRVVCRVCHLRRLLGCTAVVRSRGSRKLLTDRGLLDLRV